MRQFRLLLIAIVGALVLSAPIRARGSLPPSLNDDEFWRLVEEFSEPDGYFNSDNLLSNETTFQYVIPRLTTTIKPGGAYVGVGPEQNFAYIIALQPAMAFVPDIRRGNLQVHLLYKALIELAPDRAEFLSLLFSRSRPAGLRADMPVGEMLDAFATVPADDILYRRNFAAVKKLLTATHQFRLDAEDFDGIDHAYSAFRTAGPMLSYNSARPQRQRYPTYAELQRETDGRGQARGYLASEANYRWMKKFEERNLLVPLVGDFAGPKTIRAVGAYLRDHGATVAAFYTSNVENYLFQSGVWGQFAKNVSALPLDGTSTFIRACFDACQSVPGSRSTTLLDSMPGLLKDFNEGKVRTYWDVLAHSH